MTKELELQEQMMALVRAFGLHKPEETPCGQPITVAEAYTLSELTKEKSLSQNDLVQRLNLAKSSVSRMVDKLVKRGWIQRERSPADGRVWLLSLTDAGKKTAVTLSEARQTKFSKVLNLIPSQEQESVLQSLYILIKAMRESN